MPGRRSCCCRRKSRCCSWARNGRAGDLSHFSAISVPISAKRCARGGAANSPIFPSFRTRPRASASPTRPMPRHSRCRGSTGPNLNRQTMPAGLPDIGRCWKSVGERSCRGLSECRPSPAGIECRGPQAVSVEWQLGDRSRLILVANFSARSSAGSPRKQAVGGCSIPLLCQGLRSALASFTSAAAA